MDEDKIIDLVVRDMNKKAKWSNTGVMKVERGEKNQLIFQAITGRCSACIRVEGDEVIITTPTRTTRIPVSRFVIPELASH